MNRSKLITGILSLLFLPPLLHAQVSKHAIPIPIEGIDTTQRKDTSVCTKFETNCNKQLDLIDIGLMAIKKEKTKRIDTGEIKSTKLRISAIPAAGYTLQTGFAGIITANAAFYANKEANISSILTSIAYSERNQIILPLQANFWTKDNKYNIVLDWRYLYYPTYTYGLGMNTLLSDGYLINYSALRLHQMVLRKIAYDMYAGLGYNLDYFWSIREVNPPAGVKTDFEKYGLTPTELASGLTFTYLYDTRKNSINPETGNYLNVVYRPNLAFLGNNATWRSLIIDARKYLKLFPNSDNVLAFWNYDWLTVSGTPPYLMLPNTGSDPYSNTGRGYIQGRFRGKNMLYLESEYRFGITHNGLLGGVVFANAESFSEQTTNKFDKIAPGYGLGIRVKLNKFSKTNVALDYGFGTGGSGGFFVNLGEVF